MRTLLLPLLLFLAMPVCAEPFIVAHRGASGEAPENTLPAFKLAWKQKADAIEGDLLILEDFNLEWESLSVALPAGAVGKDIFIRVRVLTDGSLEFGGFFMGGHWSVDAL